MSEGMASEPNIVNQHVYIRGSAATRRGPDWPDPPRLEQCSERLILDAHLLIPGTYDLLVHLQHFLRFVGVVKLIQKVANCIESRALLVV